ncbi:4-amino-4-deoxy-L-arabinose transferase-like glycosyltransferase [Mycobacterium sp. MAA66]|uniref:ArnT family glycosyltransferase n=1 Tax=Mycobacterium sp. MAA66 TaxID=3156297 RepID=UPI0035173387
MSTRVRGRAVGEWLSLAVLLALTAVLYLWNLSVSGWANGFYSAAAQAGGDNWTAMLFGSSDAANAITVDKTPAALWVTDISVRLFGLNSWSILVPQALEGVAAVAFLYAAVRRAAGPGAALLAGLVFATTPVAALMFRFNNPDALLVLLLVVGAYCVQRACEKDSSRWWLVLSGVAVGFGFLAKMLQAFLVLPAFGAAYLVAAQGSMASRVRRLAGATAAMVVAGGWYLLLAELWPADSRPYIGGSQHNSVVELALGYNGVGRLTGDEPGGLGNMNFDVGWGRLLGSEMGTYAGWLLPAALICLVAGLIIVGRAPRTDPVRAALILWGGWLLATAAVFSYANGIVHPYYTVALAPALGATIGIGSTLLWRRRTELIARVTMAGAVLVTVVLAAVLLARGTDGLSWLRAVVAVSGVGAAVLLLALDRLPMARAVAALAVLSCLAAPTAFAVQTASVGHTGAMPSVGLSRGGFPGGFGGGLLDSPTPGPGLTDLLTADADKYRWTAAVIGSNNAAGYQLAAEAPVLAVGGFNGTDPAPTLAQFQQYVAAHQIHYFIRSSLLMGHGSDSGSDAAQQIAAWVRSNFSPSTVENTVVYDLTAASTPH